LLCCSWVKGSPNKKNGGEKLSLKGRKETGDQKAKVQMETSAGALDIEALKGKIMGQKVFR
jgi:hypothetical protein